MTDIKSAFLQNFTKNGFFNIPDRILTKKEKEIIQKIEREILRRQQNHLKSKAEEAKDNLLQSQFSVTAQDQDHSMIQTFNSNGPVQQPSATRNNFANHLKQVIAQHEQSLQKQN
jgi:hypothetical protein